jgi:hypothetical protein
MRAPRRLTMPRRGQSESAAREGAEEASYEWVHYGLEPICPRKGAVAVRQRSGGKVTLKDMRESFSTGVDNTGNVCLWPAEEVMAHYILKRASDFAGKNICELGAGVGLCGLAMARVLKANSLLLTDGNAQVVQTLEKALQVRRGRNVRTRPFRTGLLRCTSVRADANGAHPLPLRPACVSTTARSTRTGLRREMCRLGCWCGIASSRRWKCRAPGPSTTSSPPTASSSRISMSTSSTRSRPSCRPGAG